MPEPNAEVAPDDDAAEAPQGPATCRTCRMVWFVRILLIGYAALLLVRAFLVDRHELMLQVGDMVQPIRWAVKILTANVLVGARFLLLGVLVAFSMGARESSRRFVDFLRRWLLILLLGLGLLVLLSVAESGRPPSMLYSLLPLTGYLAGVWVGYTCLRGRRAMLWLVPKVLLVVLTLGACAAGLAFLAMENEPLAFNPPKVTSAEKRRLAKVLSSSAADNDEFQRLRLSERDVNLLLAMSMAQVRPEGKARIDFEEGEIAADLSMRVPGSAASRRYVNIHATCRAEVTAGRPKIRLTQCRVGDLSIPQLVLRVVPPLLVSAILNDPELEQVLVAIDSVRFQQDGVEAVFKSGELRDRLKTSFYARLGEKPEVVIRTRIYLRHLVRSAGKLPEDDRFAAFLRSAFELARRRSRDEDPVLENRAAILALAILLGHRRVETLVGQVTDDELRAASRRHVGRVTLRGRRDWPRHFLVSAALAILSNKALSDEVGLLKEELDAGEGGSGFSFSDLLADRTGTLIALAATRDEQSARKMQDRLAGGFTIDEVFPPAADLPEGISDRELEAEYGGVGGKKYKEIIREIERRLSECEALR